jgi:hypothetical protein
MSTFFDKDGNYYKHNKLDAKDHDDTRKENLDIGLVKNGAGYRVAVRLPLKFNEKNVTRKMAGAAFNAIDKAMIVEKDVERYGLTLACAYHQIPLPNDK